MSRFWYLVIPDHSLPPTEIGDRGPFLPFIVFENSYRVYPVVAQRRCVFSEVQFAPWYVQW